MKTAKISPPERTAQPVEPPPSSYWEVGGHPNFLLSVDERVIAARERLSQVSDTSLTVLLCGERGVGKEVLARGIHELSSRRHRPFVALNAYAVPRSAIGRELFDGGTGGKLAAVGDGTLHIHGIELLSDELRDRLIGWKKQRRDKPGDEPRFILSCEQPSLDDEVLARVESAWGAAGGAIRIEIPNLRERPEDVPLLANHILQKYGSFYNSRITVLRSSFVRFLQGYRWPGNCRELERVVRRFLVIEDEDAIRDELGSKRGRDSQSDEEFVEAGGSLKEMVSLAVARVERIAIERALQHAKWNKKRAAADLGISYKSLLNKVKKYEIEA